MKIFKIAPLGAIGATAVLLLLSGCVTYPYQTAFDACDAEAGACYRYCEEAALSDGEYAACHSDCEVGANRCFAGAYDRYSYSSAYSGSYYAPSWPWYGRYGAWGPSSGYYFDFTYWGGSSRYYDPYYRNRHQHDRRRYGDRDRGRDHDRRGQGDKGRDKGDKSKGGGAYAPAPGSPAANNPRRPRQLPQGQGGRPAPAQPTPPKAAPTPSAPAQSSPPAVAPRQQKPVRSAPSKPRREQTKPRTQRQRDD